MSELSNGGGGAEAPNLPVHAIVHGEHGGAKHGKFYIRRRESRSGAHILNSSRLSHAEHQTEHSVKHIKMEKYGTFRYIVRLYCTCWLCDIGVAQRGEPEGTCEGWHVPRVHDTKAL